MSKKFSQLTLIDAVTGTDILAILDDPGGTPVLKKCTVTQLTALCEKLASKDVANGYAGLNANGDLILSKLFPASAASLLLGRGSAGGAGDWQEVTLGTGLSMVGTVLTGTAPSGGAAWTLVATQVLSTQQNYDFTGLSAYNEIMVVSKDIAKNSAVTQMLVSTDNGLSFLNASGDYISVDASGIGANDTTMSCSGNNASTHHLCRVITNFNTTAPKPSWLWNAVSGNCSYMIPSTTALNAIRLRTHQSTFTGGTVRVYGRS
jgi:hypothetical protein